MKLSKLYSDNKAIFSDVRFNSGLNIVLASVEKRGDKSKDSHNLGKTSLGKLIDYCLLKEVKNDFFLYQNPNYFKDLSFFLEIENNGNYITIKRSVVDRNHVSILCHSEGNKDLSVNKDWTHWNVSIKKAKEILNAYLNWGTSKDFSYRNHISYFLRTQDEYKAVFKLNTNQSDKYWKPVVAELLGFNADQVKQFYSNEEAIKQNKEDIKALKKYLPNTGIIHSIEKELEKLKNSYDQKSLSFLNFSLSKAQKLDEISSQIDREISDRCELLYRLKAHLDKINFQLNQKIEIFDLEATKALFEEVNIFFPEQLKQNYEALISFNHEITQERQYYLLQTRNKISKDIDEINSELLQLEKERDGALNFLNNTDTKQTFTYLLQDMQRLSELIANKEQLLKQKDLLESILNKNFSINKQQNTIIENLEHFVSEPDGIYLLIRQTFREVIKKVLNSKAEIAVSLNSSNHLDFKTYFVKNDGSISKASEGHSYQKILCVAFDLALLRSRLSEPYSRFVFHDGVLESLDIRKKENLIDLYRDFSNDGLQIILTAIASDIPSGESDISKTFNEKEIILNLTEKKRLFNVPPW